MPAAKARSSRAEAPDLLIMASEVIAETGWYGFTFARLAEHAGLAITDIRKVFHGRSDLLEQLSERLDQAMLSFDSADMEGLPPRDRVFELMMRRLEAAAPFRPGLLRLMRDARFDPALVAGTACRLNRSVAWLQDAASLSQGGRGSPLRQLRAKLQRRLLGAVYLQTLNVWSSDEGADLAKTMASLDKQLRRIEGLANLAPGDTDAKAA